MTVRSQSHPRAACTHLKTIAKSVASDTTTLCEPHDSKGKSTTKDESKADNTLSDSASEFAKKAKKEGWAAPTATRPSFGG